MACQASKPRFFRPLLPGFQERLEIPRPFLKHIFHERYESATILSPLGKPWHAKVHGDHITSLYLEEGWPEVVQAHDLHIGYFLIFSYEGDMVFTMTVFDLSCCIKHYTSLLDAGDDQGFTTEEIKEEEQNSENIAVKESAVKKKRIRRQEEHRNAENTVGDVVKKKKKKRKKIRRENYHDNPEDAACKSFNGLKIAGEKELWMDSFTKKNTTPATTWRITIRARNLEGHYYLYIPVTFKEATGISNRHQVTLRDPNGHLWTIRVQHSTKNRTHLVEGWREFCVSNELKPGDECEFKLASDSNSKQIVEVNIFKNMSREPPSTATLKASGTSTSDGKPWFWITITPFALGHYQLQVPNRFTSATKISEKHEVTLKDEDGQLFPVPLLHTTRGRTILTNWRSFSDTNNLKSGDVCEFRPVMHFEKNNIFQVRIVRK